MKENSDEWFRLYGDTVYTVRSSEIDSKRYELEANKDEIAISLVIKENETAKQLRGINNECGNLRKEVLWLEKDLSDVKSMKQKSLLLIQSKAAKDRKILTDEIEEMTKYAVLLENSIIGQREYISNQKTSMIESQNHQKLQSTIKNEEYTMKIEKFRYESINQDSEFNVLMSNASTSIELLQNELKMLRKQNDHLEKELEIEKQREATENAKKDKYKNQAKAIREQITLTTEQRNSLLRRIDDIEGKKWSSKIENVSRC